LLPTAQWLFLNRLPHADKVRLLKVDDPQDPVEFKRSYLRHVKRDHKVVLFLDDWPSVCDMAEDEGVPAICINPRYAEDPLEFFMKRGYTPRISR